MKGTSVQFLDMAKKDPREELPRVCSQKLPQKMKDTNVRNLDTTKKNLVKNCLDVLPETAERMKDPEQQSPRLWRDRRSFVLSILLKLLRKKITEVRYMTVIEDDSKLHQPKESTEEMETTTEERKEL